LEVRNEQEDVLKNNSSARTPVYGVDEEGDLGIIGG